MSGPLLTKCHVSRRLLGESRISMTKNTYAFWKSVCVWRFWLDYEHVLLCFLLWYLLVVLVKSFLIILLDDSQHAIVRVVCIASQQSVSSCMHSDCLILECCIADIARSSQETARINDFDCKHRVESLLNLDISQFFVGFQPLECSKSLANFSVLHLRVT